MTHKGKGSPAIPSRNVDFQRDVSFYKFILQSLPVGILAVDSELKITSLNPWAEKLTGYTEGEAVGQYCGGILQGGMCKVNCPLRTAVTLRSPVVQLETTIQNKYGETIPIRLNTAALFDDVGNLIGAVEGFQDISSLKTLEREKANLISMFAHDMKSSLTVIGGFALRLLKKGVALDEEKQNVYLEMIKKAASQLEFLVDDFLEFSRLQTGNLKLDFSATSLDKELMELFGVYEGKAKEADITLELRNEQVLPIIAADSNRLRRVFTNLLDNALKFSLQGGKITLKTQETDEDIRVRIEDQGTGISAEDLPFIFDNFFRGGNVGGKEGSGQGLAIAKAIVEGHGGRILVESESGKGSAFTVVIPKDKVQILRT